MSDQSLRTVLVTGNGSEFNSMGTLVPPVNQPPYTRVVKLFSERPLDTSLPSGVFSHSFGCLCAVCTLSYRLLCVDADEDTRSTGRGSGGLSASGLRSGRSDSKGVCAYVRVCLSSPLLVVSYCWITQAPPAQSWIGCSPVIRLCMRSSGMRTHSTIHQPAALLLW